MNIVVLNREDYFTAMNMLSWPKHHIFSAGALWVILALNQAQIDTLKNNNIPLHIEA